MLRISNGLFSIPTGVTEVNLPFVAIKPAVSSPTNPTSLCLIFSTRRCQIPVSSCQINTPSSVPGVKTGWPLGSIGPPACKVKGIEAGCAPEAPIKTSSGVGRGLSWVAQELKVTLLPDEIVAKSRPSSKSPNLFDVNHP